MPQTKETDEKISLDKNEEDDDYFTVRQGLDSMVSRRAKKYKNYSHPCLQKSTENLISSDINNSDKFSESNSSSNKHKVNDKTDAKIMDKSDTMMEKSSLSSSKTTKETSKENKETVREYRVIHRPPLPPNSSYKLIKTNFSELNQHKPPNFNDLIDNILSSNTNIREYLRELRKNSELDYLLLSKILEKTLVSKSNAYVQTDQEPTKQFRTVETNTTNPHLSNKQTQTRESRILSYKLLETENLFEKLKIQNNFNSNYEIRRTSDLRKLEESNSKDYESHYEETKFQKENKRFESTGNYCLDCNQAHDQTRNKTIKIEDKFIGNQDKIQLWNNLLQIDNTSEYSEDNSQITSINSKQDNTTELSVSENQSTLSDDDQFSVSTRKSKKSYSSIKSVKSSKSVKSTKSTKRIKNEVLNQRENDLIEKYKRIKDFKSKYETEKQEFLELKKQFKNLRKKLKNKNDFDNYQTREDLQNKSSSAKEQKKISFNEFNKENNQPKYTRFQCEEHYGLPECETTSVDESETTGFGDNDMKEDEESYLTDSEYSIIDRHQNDNKNVEFIDDCQPNCQNLKDNQSNQSTVKTESKILIETTNLKKKEISEISSQTELTKDGFLSRKTQVINVKKVPVLVPTINYDEVNQFNTKTPEPIVISPTSTPNTPSATLQRKSNRKKHRSNTVEIHSVTPSTNPSTRPTSAIDLSQVDQQTNETYKHLNKNKSPIPPSQMPNQTKGKFFTNSYSESELNSMKKDKNFILNEQLNFGISEPFMAYDSNIYEDRHEDNKSSNKLFADQSKSLKMMFQRKPNFNKRLIENSNLQQIVEWQETNSSTITNQINSEPFKSKNGSTQPAKTVSLTTETTLQNNGNERTIETKSKAIRKFNLNKENDDGDKNLDNDNPDDYRRSASRCSSTNTVKNRIENLNSPQDDNEEEEETSFNHHSVDNKSNKTKCNRCEQKTKKKSSNKLSRPKKDNEQDEEKVFKTIKRTSNYEERSKEENHYKEEYRKNNQNSICVKNVNLDFDCIDLPVGLPNKLFDSLTDQNLIESYKKIPNYLFQPLDERILNDKHSNIEFIDNANNSDDLKHQKTTENNQINDNLSKLSFDSGVSSSMSSISYQTKSNGSTKPESISQENNTLDDLSEHSNNLNLLEKDFNYIDETNTEYNRPLNEVSKSLVPKAKGNNLAKNTEIINRITKTVYPEMDLNKKKIKKKKFVFEQQLTSPSTHQEQNDCKISSLITMEIPYHLKKKSRCSKCYNKFKKNELYETTSFQNDKNNSELELEQNSTSLSSTCSSETDSLINEEDLNTLTKFQKFQPVLINKDDDQTTWEYSLECNCFNGVAASVKTTVTQFHNQNKNSFFENYEKDDKIIQIIN